MTAPNTPQDELDEILDYLINNIAMIKAQRLRSGFKEDVGNRHNERLKNNAKVALTSLMERRESASYNKGYEDGTKAS